MQLKQVVASHPGLSLPNFLEKFVIKCDACCVGMGAVLIQNQKPITFLSQALKGKNFLLSTYENELLVLVIVVRKWRPYLLGSTFVIKTNHHNLKYLLEQKVEIAAQQMWILKLLRYAVTIEYKKVVENKWLMHYPEWMSQIILACFLLFSFPLQLGWRNLNKPMWLMR